MFKPFKPPSQAANRIKWPATKKASYGDNVSDGTLIVIHGL
jgi:hypothetical protein